MRNSTILAAFMATLAVVLAALSIFAPKNVRTNNSSSEWVFDRPAEYYVANSSVLSVEDAYLQEALKFEAALRRGEPEQAAAAAIENGNYGFVVATTFGPASVPGIMCVVAIDLDGPLFRRAFVISDYRTGASQTRRDNAISAYARRYNKAVLRHPKTPFKDVCRAAKAFKETILEGTFGAPSTSYQMEIIKSDDVGAANPLEFKGAQPSFSLFDAARNGETALVKERLTKRNVNDKDGFGMTALGWATVRGRADIVRLLIDAGADLNAPSGMMYRTPLIWAIYADRKDVFQLLLNAGADVNASGVSVAADEREMLVERPLYTASIRGADEYLQLLVDAGAALEIENETSALSWAAEGGDVKTAKLLLQLGADPNHVVQPANQYDDEYLPPLSIAADNGSLELVKLLLDSGADIDAVNVDGDGSALQLALEGRHTELVRFLMSAGADPNVGRRERAFAESGSAESPLHEAVFYKIDKAYVGEPLELLIAAGADLDEISGYQRDTALGHAADWLLLEPLQALIDAGADPNIKNEDGESPIIGASTGEYTSCSQDTQATIVKLLAAGADATAPDDQGRTAFWFRCSYLAGDELIRAGLDVNARDKFGRTAISSILSCLKENNTTNDSDSRNMFNECKADLKFLLKNGANMTVKDNWGLTPWDAAETYGVREIVQNILQSVR